MPEEAQDELVVDIPETASSVDVVVDSFPDEEGVPGTSQEHEDYSKKVKRRIDKLTKKAREAERQQQAAVEYARGVQAENNQLRTRVHDLDQGYIEEYGDRVATQSDSLSRDLETAIATNDTSSQVEINKKLSQLAIEEERVKAAKQQQAESVQRAQYDAQQLQAQQAQAAPVQAAAPARPDPRAVEWAEKPENQWFGEDDAMTFAAFGIHKTLVEQEDFDTNSPEYYRVIDERMREAFPHKFGGTTSYTGGNRPQQAVASATRSGPSGRKTVRLSPSEVTIANKLGVPLDQYAKYKR